jgi:hypothetical protein
VAFGCSNRSGFSVLMACRKDGSLSWKIFIGVVLGLACADCSNFDWTSYRAPKLSDSLRLPAMAAPVPVGPNEPVKSEQLVDAQGQCPAEPMTAPQPADGKTADPVTVPPNAVIGSTGIGLGMTECDVVKRAGPPENMALGTNERSERTLTLTYTKTMRPGIYSFVAGRLVTIDRAPEPPAPAKPARPAKTAKPKPKPKPKPNPDAT